MSDLQARALRRRSHRPQAIGRQWLTSTRATIIIVKPVTRRTRLTTVSYTPTASNATARHFCPPTSHQGLLEPDAGKRLASRRRRVMNWRSWIRG